MKIELVNVGEASRVKQGELGHWICPVCGAAKTPYAVPAEITNFLGIHKERCGKEPARLALSVQAEVDLLQFHSLADESAGMNIGEALRSAATRLLDMGQDDLQLLMVQKSDETRDLLIYDPMPGGSGLLEQMLSRWRELITAAKDLLSGCVQQCETACYACLKTFRNQFHHTLLDRHRALALMDGLDQSPEPYRDIAPVFEEEPSGDGTPSNSHEARLVQLLHDHHFPEGECRKSVTTSAGLSTTPDWLHEPTKVAVYVDGMSRSLHGDPKTAQRDQLIRGMMELDGYSVIVVQSRDLSDPQAVRQHLQNIATALGLSDVPAVDPHGSPRDGTSGGEASPTSDLLALCDERCMDLLRTCSELGRPLPVVGYELQDDNGRISPYQAELAWVTEQVAVVLPESPEAIAAFRDQGWTVYTAGDAGQNVLDRLITE